MSKTTKIIKVRNLFNNNHFSTSNYSNIFSNKTDTKSSLNNFPFILKCNDYKLYDDEKRNLFLINNYKKHEKDKINKTFYSIKRQVHHLIPRAKSDFNKQNKVKFENSGFKNIFHSDTFEKIRNNIYYNEFNKELHEKKKNYNKLLFNLIKKNKASKKGELSIKFNLINEIDKNIIKKKKEKHILQNKKVLKAFKSYNFISFKKNMSKSLEKQNILDKKIRSILDNVENKFDNIFIDVMDKKYTLNQIHQIKINEKSFKHALSDIKFKI